MKDSQLNQKAMLVHLRMSTWTGRTKDSTVTKEVVARKHSSGDSGAWWTYLVPRHALRNIFTTQTACRNMHFKYTLPWQDGGMRILPSALFIKYTSQMRKVIATHEEAIRDFLKEYPTIVSEARNRLGELIKGRKFPTVSEIRHKFGVRQDVLPMPSVKDFRVDLSNDDVENIRKNISTSIENMTATAMTSLWTQLTELVDKIQDTMKQPKKIFRDSLIDNLKNFIELVPKMNLTNNKELEVIRKEVTSKLANLKPMDLRESKADRKAAAKSAKEILNKIKGYTG